MRSRMPEAAYVGLVVPRFMLRNPYGDRTDPIDSFDFEESPAGRLSGMLWGNSAVIAGCYWARRSVNRGQDEPGSALSIETCRFIITRIQT